MSSSRTPNLSLGDLSPKIIRKFKEIKPEVNSLSPKERDCFLDYVKEHDPHYYPVLYFVSFTGLRKGELHALRWREVNLHAKTVLVKYSMTDAGVIKTTKTARVRTVYLTDTTCDILRKMKTSDTNPMDFVFLSTDGGHLRHNRLSKVVRRNAKRAGIKHISVHSLRHTCASAIANNSSIVQAQQALGHSQITTTMSYYHQDEDALRKAMRNQ